MRTIELKIEDRGILRFQGDCVSVSENGGRWMLLFSGVLDGEPFDLFINTSKDSIVEGIGGHAGGEAARELPKDLVDALPQLLMEYFEKKHFLGLREELLQLSMSKLARIRAEACNIQERVNAIKTLYAEGEAAIQAMMLPKDCETPAEEETDAGEGNLDQD